MPAADKDERTACYDRAENHAARTRDDYSAGSDRGAGDGNGSPAPQANLKKEQSQYPRRPKTQRGKKARVPDGRGLTHTHSLGSQERTPYPKCCDNGSNKCGEPQNERPIWRTKKETKEEIVDDEVRPTPDAPHALKVAEHAAQRGQAGESRDCLNDEEGEKCQQHRIVAEMCTSSAPEKQKEKNSGSRLDGCPEKDRARSHVREKKARKHDKRSEQRCKHDKFSDLTRAIARPQNRNPGWPHQRRTWLVPAGLTLK